MMNVFNKFVNYLGDIVMIEFTQTFKSTKRIAYTPDMIIKMRRKITTDAKVSTLVY